METSPQKILENFYDKLVNREITLEKILHIIENSENIEYRILSIEILKQLASNDEMVFNVLENLIISDSEESIRNHAIEAIGELYLEKSFPLLKWAFEHEKSLICLINIIKTIGEMNNSSSKLFLFKIIQDIDNPRFKKDINQIQNQQRELKNKSLASIIINYLIVDFLEKKYDRIDYETRDGLITELELSNIGSTVFNFNVLRKIPKCISYLYHLDKLDLKINRIAKIPSSMASLTSLKYFDMSYNRLKILPSSIGAFSSLKTLYLRYNHLIELPVSIGNLSSLKILDLSSNNIKILPDSITCLKNLEILDLHGNGLQELPDNLGMLRSLVSLELGLNDLTNLPDNMKKLSKLNKLVLGGNKRLNLDHMDWISKLPHLKELFLYENNIKSLEKIINTPSPIEFLNLDNNSLDSLPMELLYLKNLKSLNLKWNNLTEIPEWVIELQSLEELKLWGNKLKTFPKIILQLPALKLIDLNYNKISSIDLSIITSLNNKGVKLLR